MTAEMTKLVLMISETEKGMNELWDKFQHETRIYLTKDSSEKQCDRSAQAGADYRKARITLGCLRDQLVMARRNAGDRRFDYSHPERDLIPQER